GSYVIALRGDVDVTLVVELHVAAGERLGLDDHARIELDAVQEDFARRGIARPNRADERYVSDNANRESGPIRHPHGRDSFPRPVARASVCPVRRCAATSPPLY